MTVQLESPVVPVLRLQAVPAPWLHAVVRVAVSASDALSRAGVEHLLRDCPGVVVAADGARDVVLVVAETADEAALRQVLTPRGLTWGALTARETDVLRLIADGCDTAEVARALCWSERTVKNVVHDITTRLHLRNRAHAVAYAVRQGLI